ncbi:divalent-cation tolerance protein CutA [Methyloversatilis sp.]|uniref:divalent-cation tolerance protein CutA n=1 Tax=Methyloversatilis sp. TaxID=2569862 RepID=UPI0035B258A6
MTDLLLVFTSLPDAASAQRIARALVEARHAACVSIGAPVRSVFVWQCAIEETTEIPLMIKTTVAAYGALESALRALHPYEVPEIIALPVDRGLPAYLQWAHDTTQERTDP